MYKNYIQHRCRPILSEKLPKIGEAGTTLSENMVVDALNPVCSRLRRRPPPPPRAAKYFINSFSNQILLGMI